MEKTKKGLIVRSNLMNMLDQLMGEHIIYVNAPAGFGKSTVIHQWVNKINCTKVFLSFDEYDNDETRFCLKLCAALCASQPQNKALAEIVGHPAFLSAPEEFTLKSINVLSTRKHIIHVIDDLHFLKNERTLRILLILLKRLPDAFRIILISRNDLPAGFSELWIKGRLARVREEHLRFTADEIEKLYKKHGKAINEKIAGEIFHVTGGWPIGVGALLLAGGEPTDQNLKYLDDAVFPRVWDKWDDATRSFMLSTAAARELKPQLCNVLAGVENSEAILRKFMREGAFVSRTKDGSYHYQCLFQGFLKRKLKEQGDEYLYALYEKEGRWHLSRRDFYSSLDCFVKCENYHGIAQCFALLVDIGQEYFLIDKLLSVAHVSLIHKVAKMFPYIYSILSWAAFNEGRAEDMAVYADLYYQNQAQIIRLDPRLQFNVMLVRLIDFRCALSDVMAGDAAALSEGVGDLRASGVTIGTINQNMPYLHRGTRDLSECAMGDIAQTAMIMRASIGALFGEASYMLMECLQAGLFYEQGELDKAYVHALSANASIDINSSPESAFFSSAVLLSILDALGDEQRSERQLDKMHEMIESQRAYYLFPNFHALIARRAIVNGDLEKAREWLNSRDAQVGEIVFFKLYTAFTTARARIAAGDYDLAIESLQKILELAQTYRRPLDILEANILLAIAYRKKKRGFQSHAMRCLADAVSLAYTFGFTQVFVNEGPELAGLLQRLQRSVVQRGGEHAAPVSFIKILCLKMRDSRNSGLTSGQEEPDIKFTDKQRMVMAQLCGGKSYKEIAQSMNIKLPTLRSHIALIYKKLDVTNEADAVRKISRLGLHA